ncbi:hypothetical protein IAU59_000798 [Kwoniella sp. CBS 9459]
MAKTSTAYSAQATVPFEPSRHVVNLPARKCRGTKPPSAPPPPLVATRSVIPAIEGMEARHLSRIDAPPPYEQLDKNPPVIDPMLSRSSMIGRDTRESATSTHETSLNYHHGQSTSPAPPTAASPPIAIIDQRCTISGHQPKTHYGTVGIIAGIVFFPWGLFW